MKIIEFPELVFGIAGAVGIDINEITASLTAALSRVEYRSIPIRLMTELYNNEAKQEPLDTENYYDILSQKIEFANDCREKYDRSDLLATIAIRAIQRERENITASKEVISPKTAYILRQLKRPEEIDLLRQVYGKKFILVSAYGSEDHRRAIIEKKIGSSSQSHLSTHDVRCKADDLIERDAEELFDHGQRLRDTFHLADVFVDGILKSEMDRNITRFIEAFFGRTDLTPTKSEYGMYAAKAASLRSSDLSRQVGAAIFSNDGELITQGCNEVPKAFGGTYWDTEEPDYRDVKLGHDPNERFKQEIIKDLIDRLGRGGFLSEKAKEIGAPSQIAADLTKSSTGLGAGSGALVDALVTDLTEFGRVVHAEMCAICDAARLGKPVKGGTLFCTTFPCHNCTKHILAAGLRKVVYMEPYPKSKAKELHENEIEIEKSSATRVAYTPFVGISPLRYRDIFQKGRRKNSDGTARRWVAGKPRPMLEIYAPLYIDMEALALSTLIGKVEEAGGSASATSTDLESQ